MTDPMIVFFWLIDFLLGILIFAICIELLSKIINSIWEKFDEIQNKKHKRRMDIVEGFSDALTRSRHIIPDAEGNRKFRFSILHKILEKAGGQIQITQQDMDSLKPEDAIAVTYDMPSAAYKFISIKTRT